MLPGELLLQPGVITAAQLESDHRVRGIGS